MYEYNTTDVEGGLSVNTKYDEYPTRDTGFDGEVPMPEVNDNDVNTSVMLQRENSYSRGKVIGRKRDAYGNAVGRTNDNPIYLTQGNIVLSLIMERSMN